MAKRIFLFIVLMRALAAMVITNSHYEHIYPYPIIANGGLLGDVLFFAVSGFCLASPTMKFHKWYLKRLLRIYIPVWLVTAIYVAIGCYDCGTVEEGLKLWLWPTYYHFVGSIILLYIPFYFIARYMTMTLHTYIKLGGVIFAIQLVIYLVMYDHSYYHIDKVREPMIWFLFFQGMLSGLFFRQNEIRLKKKSLACLCATLLFVTYFVSKMAFVKYPAYADFQLLNQMILFGLLVVLFVIFQNMEQRLNSMPQRVHKVIKFLADHTLEIYLVQYVIIGRLNIGPFPINWLLVTICIIVSASLLRILSQILIKRINL